jgi:hypothetical protein
LYSLVFYVPESHVEEVKRAVFDAGAGRIGDYRCCAWHVPGTGQFELSIVNNPESGLRSRLEFACIAMVQPADSALPPPEDFESLAMPGQNDGWLHHHQTFSPTIPDAGEHRPEGAVGGPKLGPRASMYQTRELVAQRNILGHELGTVLENGSNNGENQWALERHPANHSLSPDVPEKPAISPPDRVMTRHSLIRRRRAFIRSVFAGRLAGPLGLRVPKGRAAAPHA